MGKLDGKVAFITGAARGQGRSHAVKLASEGADIIAVDLCEQIATVEYPMSTPEDLAETVRLVEALDRRIVATQADVRDLAALQAAVQQGEAALGPIDIIVANAGIAPLGLDGDPVQPFLDVVAVNLTGVYNTVIAAVPSLIAKQAGAIVLTSSTQGLKGTGGNGGAGGTGYAAAKHGVVGLMRSFANWLGPQNIRVNSIHPTGVATPMIQNAVMEKLFAENPDAGGDAVKNLMPIPWVEPIDISNAIAFLVSDDARYVTGVTLPVDAGFSAR